ncbi:homeobox protein 32, ZINC FINGER HOMEODOMAIN 14 [Hibiscus trionum]|uniref:Homeobox protein 32, ZINC FINGER HOMEODOMAIN 14 n=1 Tax=Hibiscus trionum TaxID=183268 RepID=A0A9W7HZM1_HIBTR|nr:homeobox protein 32, ZINC FINGER HOMEODOMAIN 14 [Hibiscus trionum]
MVKEIYRDCQRNHACSLGGYALDGCTEFIRCNSGDSSHCEACGCHRNYHRKALLIDLDQSLNVKPFMSLREAKRMARQGGVVVSCSDEAKVKQRKTKFSVGQREAMREFAESLGWSMRNKGRHEEVDRFCERIGVSRLIFKTWLNNNKKCYFKGTATAACEAKNSPP